MAVLLTGLTGNLGSELARLLNYREEVFCIVRNKNKRLKFNSIYGIGAAQIIEGDITENCCDIKKEEISFLKSLNIEKIVHCAASIKFDEELRANIWKTNYQGTINVLDLASRLDVVEFHYISTAYASTRRNAYEDSKFEAEQTVKNSGMIYSIYAPSIIIGDSKTGHTNSFNGLYGYLAIIHRIVQRSRSRIDSEKDPYLPIFIYCKSNSTLNFVPIDWVANMLCLLIGIKPSNNIYYLVNPKPPEARWFLGEAFNLLGLKGYQFFESLKETPFIADRYLSAVQKAVERGHKRYWPYVTEELRFSLDFTSEVLGERFIEPPAISLDILTKLINFAVSRNFKLAD